MVAALRRLYPDVYIRYISESHQSYCRRWRAPRFAPAVRLASARPQDSPFLPAFSSRRSRMRLSPALQQTLLGASALVIAASTVVTGRDESKPVVDAAVRI